MGGGGTKITLLKMPNFYLFLFLFLCISKIVKSCFLQQQQKLNGVMGKAKKPK